MRYGVSITETDLTSFQSPSGASRRQFVTALGAGAAATLLPGVSAAQDAYPSRPVKLIVNFPPGGVTDATFRKIAERFQVHTGQALVIENKGGRGVAPATLVQAPPDGYTLGVVGRTQLALYHQLSGKLPYDPVEDFTWIANVTSSWFGLYTRAQSNWRSLRDVIADAKAKPGKYTFGTAFGHGGLTHVPMDEFMRASGTEMLHVPFKGDSDSIMQLIRGDVDLIVAGGSAMPFVQDKRLRLLAWLTPNRHPALPEIPTFREFGYPVVVVAPVGIGGPKGMNKAHVARLEGVFATVLKDREVLDFMDRNYQRADFMNSAEFTAWAHRQFPIEKQIVQQFDLVDKAASK
jgi:tripartite-type tricarboxylate transporter receptor subunit TctC